MSLYLIAGNSGTGKTTVRDELRDKGYEAYDIDNDGLARWQHTEEGHIHPKSSVKASERTPDFLATHSWNVPKAEIEALRDQAKGKNIFLTGNMSNLKDVHDLFDGVIALYVDEETLTQRLLTRTTGDWGKRPNELADTLERHRGLYDELRKLGAIVIDSAQPIGTVTESVLLNTVNGPETT